jgi:hypothetical protein
MKYSLIITVFAVFSMFTTCQKNNMMDNSFNVDTQKYENQLIENYTQAKQFHAILSLNKSTIASDSLYQIMMYNKYDNLFSEHFYDFCIDMMQNSGMMSASSGMMGSNSKMMGSGGMMNGGSMGGMQDMNKMLEYMNNLHSSDRTLEYPDYFITDSLMCNQLKMCKMMTFETEGIEIIFNKMQILRKEHQLMH